jgi:hypothetical protein
VEVEDTDGNAITLHYRWLVNGIVLRGAETQTIPASLLRKGDTVTAEVTASDGLLESPGFMTEPLDVVNTKPVINNISLELEPSGGQAVLKAKVEATDPDGDDIQYFYRWWRNDQMIKEGSDSVLDTGGLTAKDSLAVEVVPRDQEGFGISNKSLPITVGNTSPQITSKPALLSSRHSYDYTVEAKDPDGDILSYALEIAPPGMAIDTTSGQITWDISSGLSGAHRVKVTVHDGQGGTAWQEFEIAIPSAARSESKQPLGG